MKRYPANVKDTSGRSDSVQPVAVVGFFAEDGDEGYSGSPVVLPSMQPSPWSSPSTAIDVRSYSDVEVQLVGAPAGYVPQRSLDGSNFVPCNAYDKDGVVVTTISAAGIYTLPGGGYLKLTGGSGATSITVRAGV